MNPIFDINKSIKENGVVRTIIILVLLLLIIGTLSWFFGYSQGTNININNTASVSDSISKNHYLGDGSPGTCIEARFEESKEDWNLRHYKKPDEQGFYCPKSYSAFLSPDIWYGKPIPTAFNSLEMGYQLVNEDGSTTSPPTLVFSLGNEPRVLRFYAPEKNPQIVGFEKVVLENLSGELKREPPRELREPIKYGTPVEINVRSFIKRGNEATYTFNLTYISAITGESFEDSFSYDIKMPDPRPGGEHSEIEVGFGTFQGSCVKPKNYKFCY